MENTWYLYVIIIALALLYFNKKEKRRFAANKILIRKKSLSERENRRVKMKELAQRFLEKDVYIKLLDGNVDGIVKEVTDSGIVLEYEGKVQIVNLDYVIKIKEYPHNKKNGKRSTLWGE